MQTDGRLDLGPGTLYGCLKRMLTAALVEESDVRSDPRRDRDEGRASVPAEPGEERGGAPGRVSRRPV
ncbi:MAG: hypothetical protein OXF27_18710 [Acidobacteria bacterium]|nr:hypothetical protein [Acidobacteriota bacterium]